MAQYEPMYDSFRRRASERYVPSARMSVSSSVYLPGSEVDLYTGQLKPDHQRRCRVQSKRLEEERLEREKRKLEEALRREESKGGIRISARLGILLMACTVFVCGILLLYQQGRIVDKQKEINRQEKAIAECRTQNAALEAQIAEACDSATVCYAASQNLGMVPAESVNALHLEAVDTRPMLSASQASATQPQTIETQATPVPAIASN